MITEAQKQEFYKALLDKNVHYEGIFFVGVKTTGVFCRPTCPAHKPKFENCEFSIAQLKKLCLPPLSHVCVVGLCRICCNLRTNMLNYLMQEFTDIYHAIPYFSKTPQAL